MSTRASSSAGTAWSLEQAEDHLLGLELFGMRFGLERMRRLLTALGSPQERFSAVHVVGTNGKSSTVRMTAALLEAHGVRAGAFLSPHLTTFAERIRIGDADLEPDAFGAAVQRAAAAAAKVDRTLEGGERVTQFELITAAAFDELARRGVEVAVVEAGLGGRHDATGVLRAPVVVLTNVGLEHTRWLGPTVVHIAREKLAVVRPGATLVLGDVDDDVLALARATGAELVRPQPVDVDLRGFQRTNAEGTLVRDEPDRVHLPGFERTNFEGKFVRDEPGVHLPGFERTNFEGKFVRDEPGVHLPGFQRTNFAVACAAARAVLGRVDDDTVAAVARRVQIPGRMQTIADRPLTILDGAHNASGVAALVAALPERPFTAVVSILDDKDAGAMLAALRGRCERFVCTAAPTPRALPAATLASLVAQLGGEAEVVPVPRAALERAREIAGPEGAVIATGSIYLVADLVSHGRRKASAL